MCTMGLIEWKLCLYDGRLLVRGLVKLPGKARLNGLSNSRKEFHQTTTYQKPSAIIPSPLTSERPGVSSLLYVLEMKHCPFSPQELT